ncbi:hypothetical protein, partial [Streptosporangium sp. NPDC048865]|uniref:hypothetical protein n=1 Tax=Streptosporangium sp. NPDC048865 TaxID=3155766 RepID=UPI003437CED2
DRAPAGGVESGLGGASRDDDDDDDRAPAGGVESGLGGASRDDDDDDDRTPAGGVETGFGGTAEKEGVPLWVPVGLAGAGLLAGGGFWFSRRLTSGS